MPYSPRRPLAALGAVLLLGVTACSPDRLLSPDAPPPAADSTARSLAPTAEPARAVSSPSTAPTLPATVNTAYPTVAGRTLRVPAGGNIQQAIDSARYGDQIVLQAGATYAGGIRLRKKSGSGWIVIRSSDLGDLPAGRRVTPSKRADLARLVGGDRNTPIVRADDGAHHYRLAGLELAVDPAVTTLTELVALGDGYNTTVAAQPSYIVLDRSWVHANATTAVRRCVSLNGAHLAVVDSWLEECHHKSADAQAIAGWNGPGPLAIVNNYLAGSAEVIMFGGSDPAVSNLVPSDVQIRGNHITRPTSWKKVWLVKNLLELKNARRVLVEGNVLENNWQDGQTGYTFLFKSTNQAGRCTWCVVRDVTVRYNVVRNSPAALAMNRVAPPYAAVATSRIAFHDNFLDLRDSGPFTGTRHTFLANSLPDDVSITQNTILDNTQIVVSFGGRTGARFDFSNNIAPWGPYGIKGDGAGTGLPSLKKYAPGARVTGNVLVGGRTSLLPSGNFAPAEWPQVGFVSWSGGDYALASSSTYRAASSTGKAAGADMATVRARTANAVVAR